MKTLVSLLRQSVPFVKLFLENWKAIGIAIATFSFVKIAVGIASVVAGLWDMVSASVAFTASLLANPIVLIIGAVVAGVALIGRGLYELEKRFGVFSKGWKSVVGWIKDAGKWVKNLGQVIWDWLVASWENFMNIVTDLWNASALKLIIDLFRDPSTAFQKWGEGLKNVFDKYTPDWLKNGISAVGDWVDSRAPTPRTYVPP